MSHKINTLRAKILRLKSALKKEEALNCTWPVIRGFYFAQAAIFDKQADQVLEKLLLFALSFDDAGDMDIYSCATKTSITVPRQDIELLIGAMANFHRTGSKHESSCPCLSLESSECDKT